MKVVWWTNKSKGVSLVLFTLLQRANLQRGLGTYKPDVVCSVSVTFLWTGQRSRYSDWLRVETVRVSNPGGGARFSAPVQTGPGSHPISCTIGTGSFPGVKERPGRDADPSPLLVPLSRKGRAITLFPLWALRSVQSPSACTRVHFTLYLVTFLHHPLFLAILSASCDNWHLVLTFDYWKCFWGTYFFTSTPKSAQVFYFHNDVISTLFFGPCNWP